MLWHTQMCSSSKDERSGYHPILSHMQGASGAAHAHHCCGEPAGQAQRRANRAPHAAPHTGEHKFGVGICGDRRVVLRSRMQRGPVPHLCVCMPLVHIT